MAFLCFCQCFIICFKISTFGRCLIIPQILKYWCFGLASHPSSKANQVSLSKNVILFFKLPTHSLLCHSNQMVHESWKYLSWWWNVLKNENIWQNAVNFKGIVWMKIRQCLHTYSPPWKFIRDNISLGYKWFIKF